MRIWKNAKKRVFSQLVDLIIQIISGKYIALNLKLDKCLDIVTLLLKNHEI